MDARNYLSSCFVEYTNSYSCFVRNAQEISELLCKTLNKTVSERDDRSVHAVTSEHGINDDYPCNVKHTKEVLLFFNNYENKLKSRTNNTDGINNDPFNVQQITEQTDQRSAPKELNVVAPVSLVLEKNIKSNDLSDSLKVEFRQCTDSIIKIQTSKSVHSNLQPERMNKNRLLFKDPPKSSSLSNKTRKRRKVSTNVSVKNSVPSKLQPSSSQDLRKMCPNIINLQQGSSSISQELIDTELKNQHLQSDSVNMLLETNSQNLKARNTKCINDNQQLKQDSSCFLPQKMKLSLDDILPAMPIGDQQLMPDNSVTLSENANLSLDPSDKESDNHNQLFQQYSSDLTSQTIHLNMSAFVSEKDTNNHIQKDYCIDLNFDSFGAELDEKFKCCNVGDSFDLNFHNFDDSSFLLKADSNISINVNTLLKSNCTNLFSPNNNIMFDDNLKLLGGQEINLESAEEEKFRNFHSDSSSLSSLDLLRNDTLSTFSFESISPQSDKYRQMQVARYSNVSSQKSRKSSSSSSSKKSGKTTGNAGVRAYECTTCSATFKRSLHLERHIMAVHNKQKMFSCHVCRRNFSRQEHLSKHLQGHQKKELKLKLLKQGIIVRTHSQK